MDQVIDLTLKHPSKILIYGPSNSGKSTFVEKLLLYMKELFDIYFDKIFYISENYFPKFQYIHGRFINKLKDINKEFLDKLDNNQNKLIIIDDKMHSATNDILISDLFTKLSHHKNITVIMLVQNLFPKSKYMRDISTNSTYIVLMSNPRETLQIKTLSSQIDGTNSNFIFNCYKDATKDKPFSYLFLDFDQNTPENVRVRTNIFPNEEQSAYVKLSQI